VISAFGETMRTRLNHRQGICIVSWGSLFVEYIGNTGGERIFAIGVFSDYRQRSTPFDRSFCLAASVWNLPAFVARISAKF
jgi:hypothetical protein